MAALLAALNGLVREIAAKVDWTDVLGILWRALSAARPNAQVLLDELVLASADPISDYRFGDVPHAR